MNDITTYGDINLKYLQDNDALIIPAFIAEDELLISFH